MSGCLQSRGAAEWSSATSLGVAELCSAPARMRFSSEKSRRIRNARIRRHLLLICGRDKNGQIEQECNTIPPSPGTLPFPAHLNQ